MNDIGDTLTDDLIEGALELSEPRPDSVHKSSGRTCGKDKAAFENMKVKMVMRIYGVTRAAALRMIADRKRECEDAAAEEAARRSRRKPSRPGWISRPDDEFMSAEEFFGV